MAVGKKKAGTTARGRKPGAARKPAKRKTKASVGDADTVKIGGKKFTKESCHSTKSAAQKHADKIREKGTLARVIKNGAKMCVYHGPRRKRA